MRKRKPLYEKMLDYCLKNIDKKWLIEDLAERFYLNVTVTTKRSIKNLFMVSVKPRLENEYRYCVLPIKDKNYEGQIKGWSVAKSNDERLPYEIEHRKSIMEGHTKSAIRLIGIIVDKKLLPVEDLKQITTGFSVLPSLPQLKAPEV